jgi:MoaA/NifB/PqqE/SkfB family radical SAM enzyme
MRHKVSNGDRVIINGGEPLLHNEIQYFLERLVELDCEVLVYSNGRLLSNLRLEGMTEKVRFIVPIHGYKELHDKITGIKGSYVETIEGLAHITNSSCKVDIKLIMNYEMIIDDQTFEKTLQILNSIPFNHAVHITKMADTITSKKNRCVSVDNASSSKYTRKIYDYYYGKYKIKLFDTCIEQISDSKLLNVIPMSDEIKVYFKDLNQESEVFLEKPKMSCMETCEKHVHCHSAVGEYTVLEFNEGVVYVGLE